MYNWRLLLLAFFAAFHPIASFTERNSVNGRELRCEYQPQRLLRDTILYGTSRYTKLPEERRFSADRHYEVREPVLYVPSVKRILVEIRTDRETRRIAPEVTTRFARLERVSNDQRRERNLASERKENHVRDMRRILHRDETSRDISREQYVRDDNRQRGRDFQQYPLRRISSDNRRLERNLEERRSRSSTKIRRESGQFNGQPIIFSRVQERRDTPAIFQRARVDVARYELSRGREERRNVRQRVDERREFVIRSKSSLEKRERRSLDRRDGLNDYRPSKESRSADRVRDLREESRRTNNYVRSKRVNARRSTETRFADRIRDIIEESRRTISIEFNQFRRSSKTRTADRVRDMREDSRKNIRDTRVEGVARRSVGLNDFRRSSDVRSSDRVSATREESLRTIRIHDTRDNRAKARRLFERADKRRDTRTTERASRERGISQERREARFGNDDEKIRIVTSHRLTQDNQRLVNNRHERRVSETRRQDFRMVVKENARDNSEMERDARANANRREVRSARDVDERKIRNARDTKRFEINSRFRSNKNLAFISDEKSQEQVIGINWQKVFYTLQGIYLCGVIMQMMDRKGSKKTRTFAWFSGHSGSLIKAD